MVRAASLAPKETHPVVVASMTSTILNNNMTKTTKTGVDGSIKPRAKKKPRKKANDMSKRKARSDPEAAVDPRSTSLLHSIDLLNSKTTPKIVAKALLALLPQGATKHDAAAKTLIKSFPLFTAELEARTSALTRKTESEGTRLPIAFHFPYSGAE